MTRAMLGGYIGCQWCDYAVKERPALAQEHSDTSKAAARSVEGSPRAKARSAVLEAIRSAPGGITAEKIEDVTGYPGNTVRPRIVQLVQLNLIRDSGRTSLTRSGRAAVLWIAR